MFSVTRLGDLLHFGQLFKACCNNYFDQMALIIRHFCTGVKIFHFSSELIFGQLLLTFGNFLLVARICEIKSTIDLSVLCDFETPISDHRD